MNDADALIAITEIITEFYDAHPRIEPDAPSQALARIAGVLTAALLAEAN